MRSAAEALDWANKQTAWPAGMCENAVWNAFGSPVTSPAGGYSTALTGWANTQHKHTTLDGIRLGAPIYFSGPEGHVALYKGPNLTRSTYTSGGGRYGDVAISTILNGWGRNLLGWGEDIFGHPIDFADSAAFNSHPLNPDPIKEEDMPGYLPQFYIASNNEALKANVGVGDIWVRGYPGAPLQRVTNQQAADQQTACGLAFDYNAVNVHSRAGFQLIQMFQEDNVVAGYNRMPHPGV